MYFPKFSSYLKWAWKERHDEDTLSCILDRMRNTYKTDPFHAYFSIEVDPHIIVCSPLTTNEYNVQGTYVYECFNNKSLLGLIKWINKNILLNLSTDSFATIGVKMRIATSMLNKLVNKGQLSKQYAILAHDIFVANTVGLYYEMKDEELPF